ncbi:hypothetical protein [Mycobacterium sp. UM_WGJ]|uniref:hypothetical protein n=1 Tax=Mycobacterium sp. UM_WGJ TaxID=1370120 RepID=UPI0009DBF501|nr:hypothetical protein [Mycobacterium sp. UM_WGJ]
MELTKSRHMPDTQLLHPPEARKKPPDIDGTATGGGDTRGETAPASPQRLPHPARGSVALLVLALAACCGYRGWQDNSRHDIQAAGAATQKAAEDYTVTLTPIDSNNPDTNFATVLDGVSGEFQDLYRQSSSQLRQVLIARKATGHGVVVDSAVKSATRDQMEVLLFVDQTVTNTDIPEPRIDRSRIVMTMQRLDGQWKAAKVEMP